MEGTFEFQHLHARSAGASWSRRVSSIAAKACSSPGRMKFCWEARPWLRALRGERALPASVLGPVDRCALAALAAARAVKAKILALTLRISSSASRWPSLARKRGAARQFLRHVVSADRPDD
jgi:hypothetical protein